MFKITKNICLNAPFGAEASQSVQALQKKAPKSRSRTMPKAENAKLHGSVRTALCKRLIDGVMTLLDSDRNAGLELQSDCLGNYELTGYIFTWRHARYHFGVELPDRPKTAL